MATYATSVDDRLRRRLCALLVRRAQNCGRPPTFILRRFGAMDSDHYAPPPATLSELTRAELKALLVELSAEVQALKQVVAEQRGEIERLKGLKGRPTIKPSGVDKSTEPTAPGPREKRRLRGKVLPRVQIEEEVITAEVPPVPAPGSGPGDFGVRDALSAGALDHT